jgi:hypothetical protein
MTRIQVLKTTGEIEVLAHYSIDPKPALIAWIQQSRKNWNTWDYPQDMGCVRELGPNRFYYDLPNGDIIGAIETA